MDQAERALGSFKARNQHMHTGPGAHLLHFPVSGGKLLNVVAFATEPQDWPLGSANSVGNMTAPATSEQVAEVFREWGPTVRNIVALLPAQLDRWAIFDTYDHPAPTFVDGRVCLAGDAAHASSPHHGAGAGIGVEDALSICTLLERVNETLGRGGKTPGASGGAAGLIEKAFRVYDAVRAPRSQWLVKSSREVCDIYEWNYPATGTDWEKCLGEITARSHKLWYFDITGMLAELEQGYETQVCGSNEAADGTLDTAGGPICV
jgi:salicylate hydroxylase